MTEVHSVTVTVLDGGLWNAACSCGWLERADVDQIMFLVRTHTDEVTERIYG